MGDTLSKKRMVLNIQKRLKEEYGVSVPKKTISDILFIFDQEIYMVIAQNLKYQFLWGTIYGEEKVPKKVTGSFREFEAVKRRHGWSWWRTGYPKVKWSKACKLCDVRDPKEYFELQDVRYTTEAREFRKDCGLPEIPEYEGLPEEKIIEYCKRADEIKMKGLSNHARFEKEENDKKNERTRLALYDYWEKVDYVPMGVVHEEWEGDTRDLLDYYVQTQLTKEGMTSADKLDKVRDYIDMREWIENSTWCKPHPELEELEEKFKAECIEQGLDEIPHVKKSYEQTRFGMSFIGMKNPWMITKDRETRRAQEMDDLLDELEKHVQENKKLEEELLNGKASKKIVRDVESIRKNTGNIDDDYDEDDDNYLDEDDDVDINRDIPFEDVKKVKYKYERKKKPSKKSNKSKRKDRDEDGGDDVIYC